MYILLQSIFNIKSRSFSLNDGLPVHCSCVLYGAFFAFAYVIPLNVAGVLLMFVLICRISRNAPSSTPSATATDNSASGRIDAATGHHPTRIVVTVIIVFAVLSLPENVEYHSSAVFIVLCFLNLSEYRTNLNRV